MSNPNKEGDSFNKITRRKFIRNAGIIAGGTALGSGFLLSSCNNSSGESEVTRTITKTVTQTNGQTGTGVYEVLNPCGEPTLRAEPVTSRLDTLDGKTVAMISNADHRANQTLPIMAELLKEKYPNVNIIPHDEMPIAGIEVTSPDTQQQKREEFEAAFQDKGVDAIISGNGG